MKDEEGISHWDGADGGVRRGGSFRRERGLKAAGAWERPLERALCIRRLRGGNVAGEIRLFLGGGLGLGPWGLGAYYVLRTA